MRRALLALMLLAAAPVAAQPAFVIEQGALVMPQPIGFEAGDDVLASDSAGGIAYVIAFLAAKPSVTLVRIESHAAAYDDAGTNQALTEARARRLGAAIKAAGGDCHRLVFAAFGANKPVAAGKDPANDRIVIAMAALRGVAIGGMPTDGGGKVIEDACK
jgi:outer membrane protein OmpA-like peptidoglycan-associated protein